MCVLNLLFYYVYANAFCHLLIKQILIDWWWELGPVCSTVNAYFLPVVVSLVCNIRTINCLVRLVSNTNHYLSSHMLNSIHSLSTLTDLCIFTSLINKNFQITSHQTVNLPTLRFGWARNFQSANVSASRSRPPWWKWRILYWLSRLAITSWPFVQASSL